MFKKNKVYKIISSAFNVEFYLAQRPDVARAGVDPVKHYISNGWKEGADPHPEFSVSFYLENNADVKDLGVDPYYHWLTEGQACGNKSGKSLFEIDAADLHQNDHASVVASFFDSEFYLIQRPDVALSGNDPLEHYITVGWKEGSDPHPDFSVSFYLENNLDVRGIGVEPYLHWLSEGKGEGRHSSFSFYPAHRLTEAEKAVSHEFDALYYFETYPDVRLAKLNPLVHYMRTGWKEGRNPNKNFETIPYMLNNLDAVTSKFNPFYHYVKFNNNKKASYTEVDTVKKYLGDKIFHAMQDMVFPIGLESAERIMVFVIPEHNEMSGGIFSMFSIANIVHRLRNQHGYEVVLMTRPNSQDSTYCRQRNFRNQEDVFRFEQIERCSKLKEIYIQLPEYTAPDFVGNLKPSTLEFLKSREALHVNLLNQNIDLMPESSCFFDLRELSDSLTQSVAHHAYYSQIFADRYNLPTLLLPAYTDLSAYNPSTFEEKEKLIIYSLDDAPHREACLATLRQELPDYEFVEIRNITFDKFMGLATRCRFSVSFGEGFDGYVAQPIYQGGIGFTVYKDEFFPSDDFLRFENFFDSQEEMVTKICDVIHSLEANPERYSSLNKELIEEWDNLYSFDEYVVQIKKLINREFEIFPSGGELDLLSSSYRLGQSSFDLGKM